MARAPTASEAISSVVKGLAGSNDSRAILQRMQQYSSSVEVQAQGCKRLGELGATPGVTVAEGAMEAVVRAMEGHLLCVAVQERGCVALANLDDATRRAAGAKGGIAAVVRAMEEHVSNAGVQEAGCASLASLANLGAKAEKGKGENNRTVIPARGGIEAVIRAMGVHSSSAGVQEQGCAALANLAVSDGNKATISAKGGIGAVIQAMQEHTPSAEVQKHGCKALSYVALSNLQLRSMVRDAGALLLVEKAMSAFPDEEEIQTIGRGLLEKL